MKNIVLVAILISIVILFSGCTEYVTCNKYCSQIGLCKCDANPETVVNDVIVIKDIKVLPIVGERVRPDTEVDLMVTLENLDSDKPVTLTDVRVNPHIFSCNCSTCSCSQSNVEIGPGQIKTLSFTIKSPQNEGTLALTAHPEISVKYDYKSTSLATIAFTDKKTFKQYIEGGGLIEVFITNSVSNGPVEAAIDIGKIYQPIIVGNVIASSKLAGGTGSFVGKEISLASNCTSAGGSCRRRDTCIGYGYTCIEGDYGCNDLKCCCNISKVDKPFKIIDENSNPIQDATVKAINKDTDKEVGNCKTNSDGKCTIYSLIRDKLYRFEVSKKGYKSTYKTDFADTNLEYFTLKKSEESSEPSSDSRSGSSSGESSKEKDYQIYLTLKNRGEGEINEILPNNLTLELEDMSLTYCSEEFGGKDCLGNSIVSNKESIILRGKNEKKYYFIFKPDFNSIPEGQITVTKKITATAKYSYRISKSIPLIVSPRAEI
jgi:hypothetical protein